MKIVLQPVTKLDNDTIYQLAKDISKEFENKATVSVGTTVDPHSESHFQSAFDKRRSQWYSPKLLVCFFDKFRPNKDTKILFILDVDAYSDGLNYVLGEAYPKGGLGIIKIIGTTTPIG